jgi:hypothetical protein
MYLHNGENQNSLARIVVELLQKYPSPFFFGQIVIKCFFLQRYEQLTVNK